MVFHRSYQLHDIHNIIMQLTPHTGKSFKKSNTFIRVKIEDIIGNATLFHGEAEFLELFLYLPIRLPKSSKVLQFDRNLISGQRFYLLPSDTVIPTELATLVRSGNSEYTFPEGELFLYEK